MCHENGLDLLGFIELVIEFSIMSAGYTKSIFDPYLLQSECRELCACLFHFK